MPPIDAVRNGALQSIPLMSRVGLHGAKRPLAVGSRVALEGPTVFWYGTLVRPVCVGDVRAYVRFDNDPRRIRRVYARYLSRRSP